MTYVDLLARLRSSPRVRGVFATGSAVTGWGPASDIDLAIVLDRNVEGLRTVFTTIDGRFGDLYVFDLPFIESVRAASGIAAHSWEAVFAARLRSSRIEHDPDGVLSSLKAQLEAATVPYPVGEPAQRWLWLKLTYDLATNRRYYASAEPRYLEALEIRLHYGVMDAVTAYFAFRGLAWDGEKAAAKHFRERDPEFAAGLTACHRGGDLDVRMAAYLRLVGRVWHGPYQPWPEDFLVPGNTAGEYAPALAGFWRELLGSPS